MNVITEKGRPTAQSQVAEAGMTLIETTIALVIIMIALLGVVHSFTYAVTYNAGNAVRTESLALLQKEVERMRALKWTSGGMDPLIGGTGNSCNPVVTVVPSSNGGSFQIERTVDDDPSTPPPACEVDAASQLKDITVTIRLAAPSPGWQFAVPNTVVLRRTRGN
jgi:type II secretory pathway pseudopilin PulG